MADDATAPTGSGSKIDFETKSFLITLAFNLFCFFVTIFSFGWLREKRSDALTDQQKALLRKKSLPAESDKAEKSKRKKSVDHDRRHPSVQASGEDDGFRKMSTRPKATAGRDKPKDEHEGASDDQSDRSHSTRPRDVDSQWFGWFRELYSIDDVQIFSLKGQDVLFYLKYEKYCAILFFMMSLCNIPVILIYYKSSFDNT